jgi:CRP-like cAMP-binding protein
MPKRQDIFRGLPKRRFAPGESILVEYQKAGVLYILQEGTVEVLKDGISIGTVSEPGAVFGEVSVLLNCTHKATVRAVTPTTCHVLKKPAECLRKRPKIGFHVAAVLAKRLEKINIALVDLKQKVEGHGGDLPPPQKIIDSLLRSAEESVTASLNPKA